MYLQKLVMENYGPIETINIDLPFDEKGNPKPIIFVGKNGSGKTILLSQIVDAMYEIASEIFHDIALYDKGMTRKFFKISGTNNIKIGKIYGFSIMQFKTTNTKIEYFDKVGKIEKEKFKKYILNFTLEPNTTAEPEKEVKIGNKKEVEEKFINGAYFYQPAYRYEEPFWKNNDFKYYQFKENQRFSRELKKEIEIINSLEKNKDFLMNLVLDFTAELDKKSEILWKNIIAILQSIKKRGDIRFGIGPRGQFRIAIVKMDKKGKAIENLVPSIDNLSLGELVLLDIFINIIRHSCMYTSKSLEEIEGIVIIDEIDTHLHSDLQYEILPLLIKLFPKIQFILTTHSPLFLLGMKNTFEENGFEIRNMPSGEIISVERFSEFETAFNYLKNTEKFEYEIKKEIEKTKKPILYVEDEYYQIYQIAYLKLNNINFSEENLDDIFKKNSPFEIISAKGAQSISGLLRSKSPELFKDKKIVGLFDFDKEGREQFYNLKKEKFWDEKPKKCDECQKETYNNIEYKICYKKRNDCENIYALLLPIPERLNNLASLEWENFISYVEIENLLSENIINNEKDCFEEKKAPGNIVYYKCKKNKKNILWKKLIKYKKEDFIDFYPIFNFIEKFNK